MIRCSNTNKYHGFLLQYTQLQMFFMNIVMASNFITSFIKFSVCCSYVSCTAKVLNPLRSIIAKQQQQQMDVERYGAGLIVRDGIHVGERRGRNRLS